MLLGNTMAFVLGEGSGSVLDNNSATPYICRSILFYDTDAQLLVVCDHVLTFYCGAELLDPIPISQ